MHDVIGAVEEGFLALARGNAIIPQRLHLNVTERSAVMLDMPAYIAASGQVAQGALGSKIVSVFEHNAKRNLDQVQGVYLLIDHETGVPLSVMDGRFITAIRTAATSAVATKFMASPGKKRLGVFGAGVQARFHIDAMFDVADVQQVMIVSRSIEKAKALASHVVATHKLPCEIVAAEQAAAKANLICTCTNSSAPLFSGRLIADGTHINAVGAFSPSTRELDTVTIKTARVIIDDDSSAGREAGEILIPISEGAIDSDHVKGTLADLVSGRLEGRESPEEITVFKSCGLAIEDLVTARLAYSRAIAVGVGTRVQMQGT